MERAIHRVVAAVADELFNYTSTQAAAGSKKQQQQQEAAAAAASPSSSSLSFNGISTMTIGHKPKDIAGGGNEDCPQQ